MLSMEFEVCCVVLESCGLRKKEACGIMTSRMNNYEIAWSLFSALI